MIYGGLISGDRFRGQYGDYVVVDVHHMPHTKKTIVLFGTGYGRFQMEKPSSEEVRNLLGEKVSGVP